MNNYDQSSTGVSIELNVFFDNDLSKILFDEDWTHVTDKRVLHEFDIARWEDLWISDEVREQLGTNDGDFKLGLAEIYGEKTYVECLEAAKKNDLLDEMSETPTIEELYDVLAEHRSNCFEVLTGFTKKLGAVRVIGGGGQMTDYVLHMPDKIPDPDYIHNVFHGAPLYARLTIEIDGEETEHLLHESIKDAYGYKREELLEKAEEAISNLTPEQQKIVMKFLHRNLPELLGEPL